MNDRMKVTMIPPKPKKILRVGVYCRVSTKKESQQNSLENQISYYKNTISKVSAWCLVDIYADKASGRSSNRPEFKRLLNDCEERKIDLIMTKSISRFGRNTVDTLKAIKRLKLLGVDIIFEAEGLRLSNSEDEFYITALEAYAQEEARAKSESIKWGLKKSLKAGKSKLYSRKCFGYKHNDNGELVIDEEQAKIVRVIFDYYLQGHSIVSITKELKNQGIKSPTGKDSWSKRAVETILTNEKYVGQVLVGKTYGGEFPDNKRYSNRGEHNQYLASNTHQPIISTEIFNKVTVERQRRSNLEVIDGKAVRKSTHYSGKKKEK